MHSKPAVPLQFRRPPNRKLMGCIDANFDLLPRKLRAKVTVRDTVELRRNRLLSNEDEVVDSTDGIIVLHQESDFHRLERHIGERNRWHLYAIELFYLDTARRSVVRCERKDTDFFDAIQIGSMKSKMAEQDGDALCAGWEYEFVPVTDFFCLFENGQFFEATVTPGAYVYGVAPLEKCVKKVVMDRPLILPFLTQCLGGHNRRTCQGRDENKQRKNAEQKSGFRHRRASWMDRTMVASLPIDSTASLVNLKCGVAST